MQRVQRACESPAFPGPGDPTPFQQACPFVHHGDMRIQAALAAFVFAAAARADTVVLQNGETYVGVVKKEDDKAVVITSNGIDWTFARPKIARVVREGAGRRQEAGWQAKLKAPPEPARPRPAAAPEPKPAPPPAARAAVPADPNEGMSPEEAAMMRQMEAQRAAAFQSVAAAREAAARAGVALPPAAAMPQPQAVPGGALAQGAPGADGRTGGTSRGTSGP